MKAVAAPSSLFPVRSGFKWSETLLALSPLVSHSDIDAGHYVPRDIDNFHNDRTVCYRTGDVLRPCRHESQYEDQHRSANSEFCNCDTDSVT